MINIVFMMLFVLHHKYALVHSKALNLFGEQPEIVGEWKKWGDESVKNFGDKETYEVFKTS
jgi:hypothetical protein